MTYIAREMERKMLKVERFFKAILVTGARQVGIYASLGNAIVWALAKTDPVLFFQTNKLPVLIAEEQKNRVYE